MTVIRFKAEWQIAVAFSHLRVGSEIGSDGLIRRRDASLVGRGRRLGRARRHAVAAATQRRDRRPKDEMVWNGSRLDWLIMLMDFCSVAQRERS